MGRRKESGAEVALSQGDADGLLAMPKFFVEPSPVIRLVAGENREHGLVSGCRAESFRLGVWRSPRIASKARYITLAKRTIVLARLELNAAPHDNPDGERIAGPHLHLYKEGYGDRFAEIVDLDEQDLPRALRWFLSRCSVVGDHEIITSRELFR